jgi:hypothetical protein
MELSMADYIQTLQNLRVYWNAPDKHTECVG